MMLNIVNDNVLFEEQKLELSLIVMSIPAPIPARSVGQNVLDLLIGQALLVKGHRDLDL